MDNEKQAESGRSKVVSEAVVKRLPRYYRYLGDLLSQSITRISSKELSRRMKITASQIRQDLNNFGCFGQQGFGYNVELLHGEIGAILGLNKAYNLIIIGAGNIGRSLINYPNFARRGFLFMGLFDINPELIGESINGVEIMHVDKLVGFIATHQVDIAVLTLPKHDAEQISKILIEAGIKGIWNFSHVDIPAPEDVVIENVHLTDSLMTLSYKLAKNRKSVNEEIQ